MNDEIVQTTFDYSVFDQDTTIFLQETEDKIVGRTQRYFKDIGNDLLEAKKRIGHGHFINWIRARFAMSEDTAQNIMNVARNFGEIPNGSVFSDRALYLLSRKSTPEDARQEAKERAISGEKITLDVAKDIVETKKTPNHDDIHIKTERQKIQEERAQLEKEKQKLEKQLADQWEKQEAILKKTEDDLKEHYAKKDKDRQIEAENTIRGLLSNGVKDMAKTQQILEHTVSNKSMLQGVLQLGGTQLNSFLAQLQSLRETLDRVDEKVRHGDIVVFEDGYIDSTSIPPT